MSFSSLSFRNAILASAATAAVMAVAGPAWAQSRSFNIPAQAAISGIPEFARQADLQILAPEGMVRGRRTNQVNGVLPVQAALQQLLAGTGLRVASNDGRTVTLTADAVVEQGAADPAPVDLEGLVITGSNIRSDGVSVGSNVVVISRADIDAAGFSNTQDILQSLTLNFQGGIGEDNISTVSSSNFTGATGVNLRGLGADSTLVLINGRRLAVAGYDANFVDISGIPASAIDRIEVLPDGASAVYGADAIAGVVNVILRRDFDGGETRVRAGAVTSGKSREYQFSQTLGRSWGSGSGLVSYEYYRRTPLSTLSRRQAASSDLTPLGGDNFGVAYANPGNILNPATFNPGYAIPTGQDGTSLTTADLLPGQVNRATDNIRDLVADQERNSILAYGTQTISSNLEIFGELRISDRSFEQTFGELWTVLVVPSSNPFFVDPYGIGVTFVGYNLGKDLGPVVGRGNVRSLSAVAGGSYELAGDWRLEANGAYVRETSTRNSNTFDYFALNAALADSNPATAFNPFGDGSFTPVAVLNTLRAMDRVQTTSDVSSANIKVDGSLFDWRGGTIKAAAGFDVRKEHYQLDFRSGMSGSTTRKDVEREVRSVFGELLLPVVGEQNAMVGAQRLLLSFAARYESYEDVRHEPTGDLRHAPGDTFNPKVGVLWTPVPDLDFRATYGTSFKAPALTAVGAPEYGSILVLADPSAPGGSTVTLYRSGTSDNLDNETSRNWTLGLNFAPSALPGLKANLTYFAIRYKDRIAAPPTPGTILQQESIYSSIITRNPTQAQIDAVCGPTFQGDPANCTTGFIGAIIDGRLRNTSTTEVAGVDFDLGYSRGMAGGGSLAAGLSGTWLTQYDEAFSSNAAAISVLGTVGRPIDLRLRARLEWSSSSAYSLGAYVNYAGSYTDTASTPRRSVDAWTTLDVTASYAPPQFEGVKLALTVRNVFDSDPPFVNNPAGVGYDPDNADLTGRFAAVSLTKSW